MSSTGTLCQPCGDKNMLENSNSLKARSGPRYDYFVQRTADKRRQRMQAQWLPRMPTRPVTDR